jgi:hypothetical protein
MFPAGGLLLSGLIYAAPKSLLSVMYIPQLEKLFYM